MKLSFDMKKGLPGDSKNHSPAIGGGGGIAPKIKHFMFDPHLFIYLGEDYQMGSKLMPLNTNIWNVFSVGILGITEISISKCLKNLNLLLNANISFNH